MSMPVPANERRRLEVLWKYDLLDTPPDKSLDDLTELAAYICQTPVVLISLIDEARQWFKSRVGLTLTETPREISFCTHAILQPDVMIVPDAQADPRFAQSPLVTGEPHIRFYAGLPLVTADGHALGTLCVIDHQPRQLSEPQLEALRKLGRAIMTQIDMRRRIRELSRIPIRQQVQPSPAGADAG